MQNRDDAYRKQEDQYDKAALATGWQGPALVFWLASQSIEPGRPSLISASGPVLVRSAVHEPDSGYTGWISAMICWRYAGRRILLRAWLS
ncbi:MAG: hypothetical protein PHF64_05545 [Methanoregula sp.]|nr:hypothetical protein [Methanoregula sp.]